MCFLFGAFTKSEYTNLFFSVFAAVWATNIILSGIIEDEKSGWLVYCDILPHSRGRIVSAKYLISLFSVTVAALFQFAVNLLRGACSEAGIDLFIMLFVGYLITALSFPILFWLGASRGILVYYVLVALLGGSASIFQFSFHGLALEQISAIDQGVLRLGSHLPAVLPVLFFLLFLLAVSWVFSIRLYRKREL